VFCGACQAASFLCKTPVLSAFFCCIVPENIIETKSCVLAYLLHNCCYQLIHVCLSMLPAYSSRAIRALRKTLWRYFCRVGEMSVSCSTWEMGEMCTKFLVGEFEGKRDHLKDLGVDVTIIFQRIFEK
jgi:hypothetical protein